MVDWAKHVHVLAERLAVDAAALGGLFDILRKLGLWRAVCTGCRYARVLLCVNAVPSTRTSCHLKCRLSLLQQDSGVNLLILVVDGLVERIEHQVGERHLEHVRVAAGTQIEQTSTVSRESCSSTRYRSCSTSDLRTVAR